MSPSALAVLGLALLGLYFIGMSRVADRCPPARQAWHLASFVLGLAVALLAFRPSPALLGPENRFATNMGQLMLTYEVAPPLLLWGASLVLPRPPARWDAWGRRLSAPLIAGSVGGAALVLWHLPEWFVVASGSLAVWTLKQAVLLAAGLIAWFPLEAPVSAWRARPPVQLLYLFLWRVPMMILGVFIAFADQIIYPSRSVGQEICAPASLADQRLAGAVMITVSSVFVVAVFTLVFFLRFVREQEDEPLPG